MNATPTQSNVQPTRESCPVRAEQSEEDRVFEARLRWFLAVSRAA